MNRDIARPYESNFDVFEFYIVSCIAINVLVGLYKAEITSTIGLLNMTVCSDTNEGWGP
jgi:hypothetical protein